MWGECRRGRSELAGWCFEPAPDKFVEPERSSTPLSAIYAKSPRAVEDFRSVARDCLAHPWAKPLRASAPGPACGCPNSFPTNLSNRGLSSKSLSAIYAKSPSRCWRFSQRGEGLFGPSLGQTPPRKRFGASLWLSKFVPDEFVEPWALIQISLRHIRKKPHKGAFCVYGGERGIRTLDKAFDPILP
jgi:hypothetical protein